MKFYFPYFSNIVLEDFAFLKDFTKMMLIYVKGRCNIIFKDFFHIPIQRIIPVYRQWINNRRY